MLFVKRKALFSYLSGKVKPFQSATLVTFRKVTTAPRQPLPGLPLTLRVSIGRRHSRRFIVFPKPKQIRGGLKIQPSAQHYFRVILNRNFFPKLLPLSANCSKEVFLRCA